nr:hypothetical protein [uncultured Roseateles sp.]
MSHPAFFHADTGTVRFWVQIETQWVGASVSSATLHYRYRPTEQGDDPLETYQRHEQDLAAAVRHRVAGGSIEPVMLREYDLRNAA